MKYLVTRVLEMAVEAENQEEAEVVAEDLKTYDFDVSDTYVTAVGE